MIARPYVDRQEILMGSAAYPIVCEIYHELVWTVADQSHIFLKKRLDRAIFCVYSILCEIYHELAPVVFCRICHMCFFQNF